MNLILGFIVVIAILVFIFFIARSDNKDRYEYVKEKDEHGNIIEKVLDHKDKDQQKQPNKTH